MNDTKETWSEKRLDKRYDLELPAYLAFAEQRIPLADSALLLTANLSGGGAFGRTSVNIDEGMAVKLVMDIPFPQKLLHSDKIRVSVQGRVIRKEDDGVAIQFDGAFRLTY